MGILGPPYRGIGATIRIGREMLCLLYAGFFLNILKTNEQPAKNKFYLLMTLKRIPELELYLKLNVQVERVQHFLI